MQFLKDEEGLIGRECRSCKGYFKVKPGTGIAEPAPCHCPYCGHTGHHSTFHTEEQIRFTASVILDALLREFVFEPLKRLKAGLEGRGIFIRFKGELPPILHSYTEKQLETTLICDRCTLVYAVYGVFAYCPDCGTHNSMQILCKNLEVVEKLMAIAEVSDAAVSEVLIGDALENVVSAFDGFGRALCAAASASRQGTVVSFQNLQRAARQVAERYGIDLRVNVSGEDWDAACTGFQKRHLLAHTMGVADQAYVDAARDPQAVVGRKVVVSPDDVRLTARVVRQVATTLYEALGRVASTERA